MPSPEETSTLIRLAVAGLGGLAVGIEREWSGRTAERPRFAGIRTFSLMGLGGGLAATLSSAGSVAGGTAILAGLCALVVSAYILAARGGDFDSTTGVAALLVLGAGVGAGLGHLAVASGVFAVTWFLLKEKNALHSWVERLSGDILAAAARFSVLALVVLPLLPDRDFGPDPGFNPRQLWIFVLLFSGVSFVGFLGLHAFGASKGYALAGILGGLVSSTATTLSFSRQSSANPALGRGLALGLVAACTVMYARLFALALLFRRDLAWSLLPYYGPPAAIGLAVCGVLLLGRKAEAAGLEDRRNPLQLSTAIPMAAVFQVFLYLVVLAKTYLGNHGLLASSAVLGLTDMDALLYSMVKSGSESAEFALAAKALAIGAISNTVFKLGMALSLGRGTFRPTIAVALGLVLAASVVGFFF